MAENVHDPDWLPAHDTQTSAAEEISDLPNRGYAKDRTNTELLDSAQRLLAFRLTSQVLGGSRLLRYWPDMTNPARRFELLFDVMQSLTSDLSKEGVDTANMLLFEGFVGTCEELVRAADLLSQ